MEILTRNVWPHLSENGEFYGTLIAAFFAFSVGIGRLRSNQNQHKSEYTFSLIMDFINDENLLNGYRLVEDHFTRGAVIDFASLNMETQKSYTRFLAIIEYMSYAYTHRFIDRDSVDTLVMHRIHKTFLVSREYIDLMRQSDPDYFKEMEQVSERAPGGRRFRNMYRKFGLGPHSD